MRIEIMNQIVMPIIQQGNCQMVNIPDELRLNAERVEIYRNEAGDLVLHPLAPNRGEALLQALSAFDDEFIEIMEDILAESHTENILNTSERDVL